MCLQRALMTVKKERSYLGDTELSNNRGINPCFRGCLKQPYQRTDFSQGKKKWKNTKSMNEDYFSFCSAIVLMLASISSLYTGNKHNSYNRNLSAYPRWRNTDQGPWSHPGPSMSEWSFSGSCNAKPNETSPKEICWIVSFTSCCVCLNAVIAFFPCECCNSKRY